MIVLYFLFNFLFSRNYTFEYWCMHCMYALMWDSLAFGVIGYSTLPVKISLPHENQQSQNVVLLISLQDPFHFGNEVDNSLLFPHLAGHQQCLVPHTLYHRHHWHKGYTFHVNSPVRSWFHLNHSHFHIWDPTEPVKWVNKHLYIMYCKIKIPRKFFFDLLYIDKHLFSKNDPVSAWVFLIFRMILTTYSI